MRCTFLVKFHVKMKALLHNGMDLGVLTQNKVAKLYVEHPLMPVFQLLPKLHKGLFPPPLIVVGIESMGENLSAWVNTHLQPLVGITLAHIRDSRHLVSLLDGQPWGVAHHWLSCDGTTLYPLLPHDLRIHYLSTSSLYSAATREFLLSVTEFFMFNN